MSYGISPTCLTTLRKYASEETETTPTVGDNTHGDSKRLSRPSSPAMSPKRTNGHGHGTKFTRSVPQTPSFSASSFAAGQTPESPSLINRQQQQQEESSMNAQLLGMERLEKCLARVADIDVVQVLLGVEEQPWRDDPPEEFEEMLKEQRKRKLEVEGKIRTVRTMSMKRRKSGLSRRASSMKRRGSKMSLNSSMSSSMPENDEKDLEDEMDKVDVSKYLSQTEISAAKKAGYAKANEIAISASFAEDSGKEMMVEELAAVVHRKEVEKEVATQSTRQMASKSWFSQASAVAAVDSPPPGYPTPEEVSALFEVKQLTTLVVKRLFGISVCEAEMKSMITAQCESANRANRMSKALRTLHAGVFVRQLDDIPHGEDLVKMIAEADQRERDHPRTRTHLGAGALSNPARLRDVQKRKLPPTQIVQSLLDRIAPLYKTLESALQKRNTEGFQAAKGIQPTSSEDQHQFGSTRAASTTRTAVAMTISSATLNVGEIPSLDNSTGIETSVTHILAVVEQILAWMRPTSQ